jgi:YNFM family putative membrane transporter
MRQALVLTITAISTAVLYAPQPLLPMFANEFAVSKSSAALLVSLTLAPLALAPLCYGYLLESHSPVRIIRVSVLILAVSEIAFAFCWDFSLLLILRVIQGLTIPAILTSVMTDVSINTPQQKLQRMMSCYIAATISGGFLGRFSSGVLTSFFGWRPFFVFLSIALAISFFWMNSAKESEIVSTTKPNLQKIWDTAFDKRFQRPFTITFCLFFVLASVMNFIPFRLIQIDPDLSELLFGFIYTGYLAGIFSSLMAGKIKNLFSSDEKSIIAGLVVLGGSLLLLLFSSITIVLITLFFLSAAMFFVHTIAANKVNQIAVENKGIVNGLYISSYYAGGTIGSYAPGLIYEYYDWPMYIAALIAVALFGMYNAYMMLKMMTS